MERPGLIVQPIPEKKSFVEPHHLLSSINQLDFDCVDQFKNSFESWLSMILLLHSCYVWTAIRFTQYAAAQSLLHIVTGNSPRNPCNNTKVINIFIKQDKTQKNKKNSNKTSIKEIIKRAKIG